MCYETYNTINKKDELEVTTEIEGTYKAGMTNT